MGIFDKLSPGEHLSSLAEVPYLPKEKKTQACTISPDGTMLIFSRSPDRKSYIMRFNEGRWAGPVEAFFEGKEASFSADRNRVFHYVNGGDTVPSFACSAYQILCDFTGADGARPSGVLRSGSTVYGMTWKGGNQNLGVIFAIDLNR